MKNFLISNFSTAGLKPQTINTFICIFLNTEIINYIF
jgi:hypothetical protein